MAKNSSQSKEHKMRLAAMEAEKKKRENRFMWLMMGGLAAVVLVAAVIIFCVAYLPTLGQGEEEPPVDNSDKPILYHLMSDKDYIASTEATNFVRLNVSYTANDGQRYNGDIIVELNPDEAPITVANFQKLVGKKFYDGLTFHRVIPSFMIQGGDPEGTGMGGSDEQIVGEFSANGIENNIKHVRGTISMARGSYSMDSASSQFFIVHETSPNNTYSLDGQYAAFGSVVFGMESVDGIAALSTNYNDKPHNVPVINSASFVKPVQ